MLQLIEFRGGPLDGQMVRWREPTFPEFWNHVEREIVPVELGEDGLPAEGTQVSGTMKVNGKKVPFGEARTWWRYAIGVLVAGGTQIAKPLSGPVPLYYDYVSEEWDSPDNLPKEEYSERLALVESEAPPSQEEN